MADLSLRDVTFQRRVPMGATADKVKGATNEAIGDAKQATKDAINKAAGSANKNL